MTDGWFPAVTVSLPAVFPLARFPGKRLGCWALEGLTVNEKQRKAIPRTQAACLLCLQGCHIASGPADTVGLMTGHPGLRSTGLELRRNRPCSTWGLGQVRLEGGDDDDDSCFLLSSYYMPGTMLCHSMLSIQSAPSFKEEIEAQRGEDTWPSSPALK